MAAVSNFIWVALLLACCFQTSDSQNVRQDVYPETDRGFPLISADASRTCTSNEALELRREVSQLKEQLTTCSSAALVITGSYRNQLRGKMKNLLNTFDNDPFLILKTIALNREVNALQEKLKRAANSTDNVIDTTVLQRELEKQYGELNRTMLQIEGTLPNPALILQVISLQNQIWSLEQLKPQEAETTSQQDKAILALQEQLDKLLIQLRVKGEEDVSSAMLQLISVQTKIARTQRLINIRIEESRANNAVYQRQWRTKADLLKKKILQLSRDEGNKELTKEILALQMEVERFRQLMSGVKSAIDSQLRELRTILVEQKKLQQQLQEQLEEAEYAQAQLIMKTISVMKEMRELEVNDQDEVKSQATTLQTVIQAKEKEYANALAEIAELKRKLALKFPTWSEVDGKLWPVKMKFEQELARLRSSGESEVVLVLTLMKVRDELETLKEQIAITDDPKRLSELQRQMEEKQDELFSKTENSKRMIPNYNIISNIIELQDEIWGLEKKVANETNVRQIEELQNRVNRLITQTGPDGNIKTVLKLLTLQSQIDRLQRRLADIHMFEGSQVNELGNNLMFKRKELQTLTDNLKKENETNARIVIAVTNLQNELRNLEQERHDDYRTASFTTAELRKELKEKIREHARDHAQMAALQNLLQDKERELGTVLAQTRDLQRKLRLKSSKCPDTEETDQRDVKMSEVKREFEQMIAELIRAGNSKAASGLEMLNLNDEVVYLIELISETEDPSRISELRGQIDEKQKVLYSSLNMSDFLTSTLDMSQARELVIKIPMLQSQVEELQRQISAPSLQTTQKNKLINDLATKKRELQKSVDQLNQKSQTDVSMIIAVIDRYNQLRLLEKEKLDINPVFAVTTKLREQLRTKEVEQRKAQDQIKALQRQLNLMEGRCSAFEVELKGLQTDLDDKMKELQSKSDTVTALALQVSTLTVQVEGLKRQAQDTVSEVKVKELEKIIEMKNNELASKTEELKGRSSQAEQLLKIITTQTEIERLVNVAENENDFANISALQDNLNRLISEIQDENGENTKLIFNILAHQDEIARLKKQQESETQAKLEKIKDLENELEDIRSEIKEKSLLLNSSDTRIANLSAQIMELYKKIKPMEVEISSLKEANANSIAELQKKLDQSNRQLQDSKLQLEQEGTKNYNLFVEITDLRTKLKKAQEEGAVAEKQKISDLEQQIETQQRENTKLENTNEDLKREMNELKVCCGDADIQCNELEQRLQQCNKDADRLLLQLQEKDVRFKQQEKELDEKTTAYNILQQDYKSLQNETEQLEEFIQELQNKLKAEDDTMIRASKMVLDPDTANARLGLTARNTQVFIANEIQDVQDHPGRFNVFLAVLGKTGFSSGRHYWEVSVAEKPCYHLGMASEGARRRGQIRISPVTGFWTIIRNKQGQYQAMDKKRTVIPVQTQPLTVGILLDYKKGQISFYDAGARVHMYSFTGQTFMDKIHPFINFCVDATGNQIPIVLITPGETDWIK